MARALPPWLRVHYNLLIYSATADIAIEAVAGDAEFHGHRLGSDDLDKQLAGLIKLANKRHSVDDFRGVTADEARMFLAGTGEAPASVTPPPPKKRKPK